MLPAAASFASWAVLVVDFYIQEKMQDAETPKSQDGLPHKPKLPAAAARQRQAVKVEALSWPKLGGPMQHAHTPQHYRRVESNYQLSQHDAMAVQVLHVTICSRP